jgi:major vault protein
MAAIDSQKDLVLPPGRYVFILNDKGIVETWVGPVRVTSSGSNDTAVTWNQNKRGFDPFIGDPAAAIRPLISVSKGQYVILEGLPVPKEGEKLLDHPPIGTNSRGPDIDVSKSTVIHGPSVFALWPRQSATVIDGHRLAHDQYLVVAVRDDEQARLNPDAVLKNHDGAQIATDDITMGALFIIKGTDVSFYMPGPGLEVVKDEEGAYVRNAVTVEQLEYAYLRDQSGKKAYVRGPAVVFPRPTQTFITRTLDDGTVVKRFRAIELTETSGLYIKVTQAYTEESGPEKGKERAVGEELFLKGSEYPLYWPRVEHMLLRQGSSEIHYSIAIPDEGTGYYVRNKKTWIDSNDVEHKDGVVELIRGPKTLLIDPRTQTLVKRALPLHFVELMYPGNAEARAINEARLAENAERAGIPQRAVSVAATAYAANEAMLLSTERGGPTYRRVTGRGFEGDVATRPANFSKPHAIDLGSSKYDGAPRMAIRPGYAVMLINSIGKRRVIQGGEVALLEYDELPTVLSLSTGTPKSGANRKKDVYLRTVTKISDEIDLETSDGVKLTLELSYRIHFHDEPTKWFDIEDPVGFMTDNLRSIVHHEVSKHGVREFYADFASIIRTIVLGEAGEGGRPGRTFEENGLHIYDVDVLALKFEDAALAHDFSEAAKATFRNELKLSEEQRGLAMAKELATLAFERSKLTAESAVQLAALTKQKADADAEGLIATILAQSRKDEEGAKALLARVAASTEATRAGLLEKQLGQDQEHANMVRTNDEHLRLEKAETDAAIARLAAIQPRLIAALERLGESELLEKIASHLNVQSILGGTSVSDALNKAFAGTRFANLLTEVADER